ncbi:MAG: hypothetical protein CM1200mP28_17840 [Deltaproteobacteria bacterium]|nr:MAG: hypothetical protein CM1200mP28_17840 [Deltaproteobacteria bacterium]
MFSFAFLDQGSGKLMCKQPILFVLNIHPETHPVFATKEYFECLFFEFFLQQYKSLVT